MKITTTFGFASTVLFDYLADFSSLYPDIALNIICDDKNLDLTFREADVAIRPYDLNGYELTQTYLTQKTLGLYASQQYLENFGMPEKSNELDCHRLIAFEDPHDSEPYTNAKWLFTVGSELGHMRRPFLTVNSTECMAQAAQKGLGIITLSNDSSLIKSSNLIRVLPNLEGPTSKVYFVYPNSIEKLKIVQLLCEYLKHSFSPEDKKSSI